MKDIIQFDIAKINRGKKRLCRCDCPHYEIDTTNRIVMCMDCGAVVDAFDALVGLAESGERIERLQESMLQRAKTYGKLAEEEFHRMIKNKVFRDMQSHYRKNLYPICPKCGELFDPTEIVAWTRPGGEELK